LQQALTDSQSECLKVAGVDEQSLTHGWVHCAVQVHGLVIIDRSIDSSGDCGTELCRIGSSGGKSKERLGFFSVLFVTLAMSNQFDH